MLLNTLLDPGQVLTQPVVTEPNSGIRIGLRRRLCDEWFNHLELMDDPRQHHPLTVSIGHSNMNR